jgi:hypothetical protein
VFQSRPQDYYARERDRRREAKPRAQHERGRGEKEQSRGIKRMPDKAIRALCHDPVAALGLDFYDIREEGMPGRSRTKSTWK